MLLTIAHKNKLKAICRVAENGLPTLLTKEKVHAIGSKNSERGKDTSQKLHVVLPEYLQHQDCNF